MKTLSIEELVVIGKCLQAVYEDTKLGKDGNAVYWDAEAWDATAEMVLTVAEVCGIVLVDK